MNAALSIRGVQSAGDRRRFLELPYRLYCGDPLWVPPLRRSQARIFAGRTAFFDHGEMALFLAARGPRCVGRVAAIHNQAHNDRHGDRVGFFGFFECEPEDAEAAAGLLRAAETWLQGRGLNAMRGPVNPSMNAECGLLIEGFDTPPSAMMPHNPPAYAALLEGAGLRKCKDLFAYWIVTSHLGPQSAEHRRLKQVVDRMRLRHPEVTIRPLNLATYQEDILRCLPVFEEARRGNWGYVPLTEAEITEMTRELRAVVVPDVVLFAEVQGKPVGVALAIPDHNRLLRGSGGHLLPVAWRLLTGGLRRIPVLRVFGIAALEAYRPMGITAMLLLEIIVQATTLGYEGGEASWVLEDNQPSNQTIRKVLNPKYYKTYRIYEKPLPG